MLNLLIMILMAMSTGTECQLGTPVDYYAWVKIHQYTVVHSFNIPNYRPIWLMQDADGNDPDMYLFVFKEKDALNGGKDEHGACFQDLGMIKG